MRIKTKIKAGTVTSTGRTNNFNHNQTLLRDRAKKPRR
jgi:hypothetical protein